ncbi:MAG: symmetrical bis(5'-nucleosyl)-tetraphosphatase [Steroidobacterales bacterium]
MARWAIGDVQGCCDELHELLDRIDYSADRDQLWFTGDLVNRGPQSLAVLRLVRALGANVTVVLGNHDLHLLAVAFVGGKVRRSDTLSDVLAAPDRDALLEWLLHLPLAHLEPAGSDLLVHAGVVPQWSLAQTLALAAEVQDALRADPSRLLSKMYGDQPDRWRDSLRGLGRLRFTVNVLTRIRCCSAKGRANFKYKGGPKEVPTPWMPWFQAPARATAGARIIFGHWSALGFYRGDGVLALDTGCVWGGALTAVNLDLPEPQPVSVPSRRPRSTEL